MGCKSGTVQGSRSGMFHVLVAVVGGVVSTEYDRWMKGSF